MKPLLLVDVDGVLSLFPKPGEQLPQRPDLKWINVEGIPHMIALENCRHLASIADSFELVWATGWEHKANEHLPPIIGLAAQLPVIEFDGRRYDHQAHWKLGAVDAFVGDRPAAWIDDAHDDICRDWASARSQPTLLVDTETNIGFGEPQAELLREWARRVSHG